MVYYELFNDNQEVIGVASSYDVRKYQNKHNVLVVSDDSDAEYIDVNGELYRDFWLRPVISNEFEYTECNIIIITEEEFNALSSAIENGESAEIILEDSVDNDVDDIVIDDNAEMNLEYIRKMKLKELSAACQSAIINGFDVELSDGNTYHFSLTVQDQLNMLGLSVLIENGAQQIPYHADGELCRGYSAADFIIMTAAANTHKTYHVTYHNSLKNYVNSIDNIEGISNVYYGMDIPEEYQSIVLKEYLNGDNIND